MTRKHAHQHSGDLSTPYCSNHVEPSELDIQKKGTLQVYQDNVDSIITNELANEAESAVCEFSEYQGVFVLPSEFRAKDDGYQKQKNMTEQNSVNNEYQELESEVEPCSVDREHLSNMAQNPEEEDAILESYPEEE